MPGSHADADDAVQETRLRLARAGGDGIEELHGWLTTVTGRICLDVTGRICLDVLRRRAARREDQVATQATLGARPNTKAHPALVNGVPGALITAGGRPVILMARARGCDTCGMELSCHQPTPLYYQLKTLLIEEILSGAHGTAADPVRGSRRRPRPLYNNLDQLLGSISSSTHRSATRGAGN